MYNINLKPRDLPNALHSEEMDRKQTDKKTETIWLFYKGEDRNFKVNIILLIIKD